jgi:hypothetical protein
MVGLKVIAGAVNRPAGIDQTAVIERRVWQQAKTGSIAGLVLCKDSLRPPVVGEARIAVKAVLSKAVLTMHADVTPKFFTKLA